MAGVEMVPLIERKKRGEELSEEELRALLEGYEAGDVPDYQLAAWLMAVCWRGMGEAETLAMTRAMVASGEVLDWEGIGRPTVDKHSTGGVGDKTSIVLVPLMAAAGAAFVKMSGRGLGHTGGTLDKLSDPGLPRGDRAGRDAAAGGAHGAALGGPARRSSRGRESYTSGRRDGDVDRCRDRRRIMSRSWRAARARSGWT